MKRQKGAFQEKSMCKGPVVQTNLGMRNQKRCWVAIAQHRTRAERGDVVREPGWGPDHAGLGKHMELYSLNHCIYICKNTFIILIFPCDVINILFLVSLHRLQNHTLQSILKFHQVDL